jgi:hypothetical protein
LLYEKRFTIEGARKHLENQARQSRRERESKPPARVQQADLFGAPAPASPALDSIRAELASILRLLK